MTLDFLIVPTYSVAHINVQDISTYDDDPPVVTNPTLEVTIPGFDTTMSLTFVPEEPNILNSTILEITEEGEEPLPDGVYVFKYSVDPAETYFVEKTIMRVDKLQEKFDLAFMRLDMMQCDLAIKRQEKIELNSIYLLIQGAIAAANNCATLEADSLYKKADKLLCNFNNRSVCCGQQY